MTNDYFGLILAIWPCLSPLIKQLTIAVLAAVGIYRGLNSFPFNNKEQLLVV